MKLYKFLILFFLSFSALFANIKLSISSTEIIKGEPLVFTLEVEGNDISFPDLKQVDGNIISEISNSSQTNIINNQLTKRIKKTYSFIPQKDFLFPSLEVVVDGKSYYTKEQKITLKNPSKTQSDIFDLDISSSKKDLFVGENFILTMKFKYKKDANVVDLSLEKPNFDSFWFNQIDDTKKYEEKDFIILELKFLMSALKEGALKIEPINIRIQMVDNSSFSIFSSTKNLKIYSNSLDFNVKKLPNNIKLIGNFQIESSVDKLKVKKGEAVSFKIKVFAEGNVDDIPDLKPEINGLTIYENKPKIKTQLVDNKYVGEYEKVFSIVANNSFTIPSISLEYFDKNLNKTIIKKTKQFDIEILNNELKKEPILEKAVNETVNEEKPKEIIKIEQKSSLLDKIIFFTFGIIFCLLIISLYFYVINLRRKKNENNRPLIKKVNTCKSKSELLKTLAIYLKIDSKLDELILKIEKEEDIKLLKKEAIKIIKELKL
uniref:BatD family protein n=1 Tax=Aliarcobacter sp. TaxID=2321116 RepID=UPI0040486B81